MGLCGRQHSCAMLILFKGLACGVCVAYFFYLKGAECVFPNKGLNKSFLKLINDSTNFK